MVDFALLATLVLLFAFQGEAILNQPLVIAFAGCADPDPRAVQQRTGLLAEPGGRGKAQHCLPVSPDRRLQFF